MRHMKSQKLKQEADPYKSKVYIGMDAQRDDCGAAGRRATWVKRLSYDMLRLRWLLDRLAHEHEIRACYEASGAGYVLERMIRNWGYACEIVAPSLIPRRPAQRRETARMSRSWRGCTGQ